MMEEQTDEPMQEQTDLYTDQKYRVVLVDDNEVDNYLHERALTLSGRAELLNVFTDPLSALEWLSDVCNQADLVFVDLNMPGMNGFEFIQRFKQMTDATTRGAEVIVLSSSLLEEEHSATKDLGIRFEAKPLTINSFTRLSEQLAQAFDPETSHAQQLIA